MAYAPIVIPTLNRINHLKRCVESLANNPEAKETELIIGVDYPPNEKYCEGYDKVVEYVDKDISGFKNIIIIKRETNFGAIGNTSDLVDFALSKYDRCILTEDDNEFAECFLEYMNSAMDRYGDCKDVFAVYGFRPMVKELDKIGNRSFFTTYFSGYGIGLFREKEKALKSIVNRNYIEDLCCNRQKLKLLRKSIPNAETFLCSALLRKEAVYRTEDGTVPLIDTIRIIYSVVEKQYLVCCPIPLVKNWGYDGSGTHCIKQNVAISTVSLEKAKDFHVVFDDKPSILEIDYPLKFNRFIPYISARVRIWIWRIIAKRSMLN